MRKASIAFLLLLAALGCQRPPPRAAGPLRHITVACTVQPQSTLIPVSYTHLTLPTILRV